MGDMPQAAPTKEEILAMFAGLPSGVVELRCRVADAEPVDAFLDVAAKHTMNRAAQNRAAHSCRGFHMLPNPGE